MSRIIGRTVLHFDRVTSTNNVARKMAEEGQAEGLVISAEEQTAGRGRMGRSWVVPPRASLQFSVLLRPSLPAAAASSLMQMAALATASALREIVPSNSDQTLPPIVLKWPNDVLLNGKKCAGILVETGVEEENLYYAILGIGINVNHTMRDYPELAGSATTLADELGHSLDRNSLQGSVLTRLDEYYRRLRTGSEGRLAVFEEWRAQLGTLGRSVRISTTTGIDEGIATDVEPDGALLVSRADGLARLYSGEVTLLKGPEQRRLL